MYTQKSWKSFPLCNAEEHVIPAYLFIDTPFHAAKFNAEANHYTKWIPAIKKNWYAGALGRSKGNIMQTVINQSLFPVAATEISFALNVREENA